MKLYKTHSYKEAAQMAAKDVKKWNEEERRQLELIANKYLDEPLTNSGRFTLHPEAKRIINLHKNGDCRSCALEEEVYHFQDSSHGINIKKSPPSALSHFSEEELVNELCRRGWNYTVTEMTNLDVPEYRKIRTSSLI